MIRWILISCGGKNYSVSYVVLDKGSAATGELLATYDGAKNLTAEDAMTIFNEYYDKTWGN